MFFVKNRTYRANYSFECDSSGLIYLIKCRKMFYVICRKYFYLMSDYIQQPKDSVKRYRAGKRGTFICTFFRTTMLG